MCRCSWCSQSQSILWPQRVSLHTFFQVCGQGFMHSHCEGESQAVEALDLPAATCFRSRSHSYLRAIQAGCSQDEDTASVDSDSPPPTTTSYSYCSNTSEYHSGQDGWELKSLTWKGGYGTLNIIIIPHNILCFFFRRKLTRCPFKWNNRIQHVLCVFYLIYLIQLQFPIW